MPISRAACKGCAVAGAGDRGGGLVSTEIVYMIQVHGGGWVCWGGGVLSFGCHSNPVISFPQLHLLSL